MLAETDGAAQFLTGEQWGTLQGGEIGIKVPSAGGGCGAGSPMGNVLSAG